MPDCVAISDRPVVSYRGGGELLDKCADYVGGVEERVEEDWSKEGAAFFIGVSEGQGQDEQCWPMCGVCMYYGEEGGS